MDGSRVRDVATALVGAALGSIAAWVLVVALSASDVPTPEAARTSSPSGVLTRWEVAGDGWERSVVQVRNERCTDSISGTGVVVGGHVLTNAHVVDGARRLSVGTHDGRTLAVVAVAVSGRVDLAELTLAEDSTGLAGPGLTLAPAGPSVGDEDRWSMAGFPAGIRYQVRPVGFTDVLRGGRFPDPAQSWHLDVGVAGGESGSPVVDAQGRVAGLLYARALSDGDGLVMDVDTIRAERRDLAGRPFVAC